jgi:hypothetical protein
LGQFSIDVIISLSVSCGSIIGEVVLPEVDVAATHSFVQSVNSTPITVTSGGTTSAGASVGRVPAPSTGNSNDGGGSDNTVIILVGVVVVLAIIVVGLVVRKRSASGDSGGGGDGGPTTTVHARANALFDLPITRSPPR